MKIKQVFLNCLLVIFLLAYTGCMDDRAPTEPVEITRPELLNMEPSNGFLIFPTQGNIKIVFDEPMNLSTFDGRFTLKDQNGTPVEVIISQQDSIMIFTPKVPLQKSTFYYGELRGRIRDVNNNSIDIGGEPVLDDTTLLSSTWFYTEGEYSSGGFFPVYLRDRKEGSVRFICNMDSILNVASGFTAPEGMALSEDGQYIVLSNTAKNEVQIINAQSGVSEAAIKVSANPSSVVVSGNKAYVICVNGKAICKIDIPSKSLEATFSLKIFPGKLAASPDGSKLYTFDQVTRDLYILNSSDGSTIKKVTAAVDKLVTGEIVTDRYSGVVYLCDSKGFKIKALDQDGNLSTILTYPNSIEPVELTYNESFIYAAAGNSIYKYEKNTLAPADTVTFSTKVKSVTIIPTNEILYASLATSIVLVDEKTFNLLKEKDLASSGIETITVGLNKR